MCLVEMCLKVAEETRAIPYDIPDVVFSHVGELYNFVSCLVNYEYEKNRYI